MLTVYGFRRGRLVGVLSTAVGASLLARGMTDQSFGHLIGIGKTNRAIDVDKTINIAAPVPRVYQFWAHYENFPRFMKNVREVRRTGDKESHWVVAGPAGLSIEWDAIETKRVPNRRISWATRSDSMIRNGGTVRFSPNVQGGTTVRVQLSYDPRAGELGHAIAFLFGADPKSEMDEDLNRMKSLIEQETVGRAETSSSVGQA